MDLILHIAEVAAVALPSALIVLIVLLLIPTRSPKNIETGANEWED